MIFKSYLIEENLDLLKNNIVLFYGENVGLINEFKKIIKDANTDKTLLTFSENQIFKNLDNFINEIKNKSLFGDEKFFFINDATDKICELIDSYETDLMSYKIYFFSSILDKRSKLRSYFEKEKKRSVVPCYKDNDINLKKIILKKLKGFTGLTPQVLNTLIENSTLDRIKLNNELDKIKIFFKDKQINIEQLDELINEKNDEDFNLIKENVLKGNKNNTNNLLSTTVFDNEKIFLYINTINQRLNKLKEIQELAKSQDVLKAVDLIKPPIFWKDKPHILEQAKKWNKKTINKAVENTFELEKRIKSDSAINKNILIKKLLVDICLLANS
tara:strand:+ start:8157 stop:9146 length:990 start_codon:yes stop_codon:yes gene_type:complete